MGTLRTSQFTTVPDDDGNDTTLPTVQGYTVNGVLLGEPLELDGDPKTAEFDDSAFPTGTVELVDGEVVVTPDEVEL